MIDWDRLDEEPCRRAGGGFTMVRSRAVEQRSRSRARSRTPRLDQRKRRLAILGYLLEREEHDAGES